MQDDWHLTKYLLQWKENAHLEQIFVQCCRQEEWAQSKRCPLPIISPSPAAPAFSRQDSNTVTLQSQCKKKKSALIYFPLPRPTEECVAAQWQTNSGAAIAESFEIPPRWGETYGLWHNNTQTSPHIFLIFKTKWKKRYKSVLLCNWKFRNHDMKQQNSGTSKKQIFICLH